MAKITGYHISDGRKMPCVAQEGNCKLQDDNGEPVPHFSNEQEAQAYLEKQNNQEFGETAKITREKKPIKYSFVKEFKEKEKQFKKDFDGIPTRFFNANLADSKDGRNDAYIVCAELRRLERDGITSFDKHQNSNNPIMKMMYQDITKGYYTATKLPIRLSASVSSPADNKIDDEEAVKTFTEAGATNIKPISSETAKMLSKSERAWVMDYNNKKLIVSGGIRGDNMGQYALRRRIAELPDLRNFTQADIRTMKGMERIKKKTGIDLFANSLSSKRMETCDDNLEALRLLSRAQLEGKNFNRQKKYIKEHSGAVATAWMDKKNPDETRKKMMKETALNNHFSKVEIDNDVDPQEYEEFEREYLVTKDKLPPIMGDRKPELRIRKLGKHKATGIYFPHKNTIAIDVRDSSSFIHEYAHYLDIATKNNQSLNMEFSNVVRNYTREFKLGDGVPSGKTEYYCTPTEIHSRAFEIYAHERLGINNRLLNPEKFKGFDYGPIMNNPETKEEAFKFFDRVFKKS